MIKIKEILRNKKLVTCLLLVVLIIAVIILQIILNNKKNDASKISKELREITYVMYVKMNPLVKVTFKESYYECMNDSGVKTVCSNVTNRVTGYEALNEIAETVYSEIEVNGTDIIDTLVILYDVAKEHEVEFDTMEITTNWTSDYDSDTLKEEIKHNSKYDTDFELIYNQQSRIDEQEILGKEQPEEEEVTYTVTFNSNGGSSVAKQTVVEKEKVEAPTNPTRKGYIFVEWQLNGRKYDFNKEVIKDITLIAKWDKEKTEEETPTVPTTPSQAEEPASSSTIDKINLNDKIAVATSNYDCNNLSVASSKDENGNDIYDEAQESKITSQLEAIKNNLPRGVADFSYSFKDHKFKISYSYLSIQGDVSFKQNWNGDVSKLTSIYSSLENAGSCSNSGNATAELNESLCSKYRMNCTRW